MVTQYTEHQEAIRKTVRDFCLKEVVPGAEERDRTGEFDYALYRRLGELGLTGILAPEDWEGSDAGDLAYYLVIEELSRADASLGITYNVAASAAAFPKMATEQQKEKWGEKFLLPIIRGEATQAGAAGRKISLQKLYQPVHEGKCELIEGESPEETGANLALKLREAKLL